MRCTGSSAARARSRFKNDWRDMRALESPVKRRIREGIWISCFCSIPVFCHISRKRQSSRAPELNVSMVRPHTAPHTGATPTTGTSQTSPRLKHNPEQGKETTQSEYQRFVLTDPIAFRYLEEDPSTTVLERRRDLKGYECYVVEQWTTSRTHPTMVITTYTGDLSHHVVVGVLSVPTDETIWSPRLRVYFKALNHYHATRRQTELGILMVTNLSAFPSYLTVIQVPDGDLRAHRLDFFVNENMKRLGCSGRVGLALTPPGPSTVAKFHQLYRVSDKNDIYKSVIELVKLCQSALMLFDKLEIDYADGLLCDVTERAINDWWIEIGNEQYDLEPQDGILGPTTVAGLLGLLMGARNRLNSLNSPVAKDAFDVEAMKKGISHFQKQQRMPKTRRLDRRTLERLHKATQKAANSEGFTLPKAVKSTVAELSGKGGEMVMDVVGRRDKAGIADIETCDIEQFVHLVYGETCKWLWLGKPMKKTKGGHEDGTKEGKGGLMFRPDDNGGFSWTARKSTVEGVPKGRFDEDQHVGSSFRHNRSESEEDDLPAAVVPKRTTGLKQEARVGIGKLRDAVGFKSHHHKDSAGEPPMTPTNDPTAAQRALFGRVQTSPLSSPNSPKSPQQDNAADSAVFDQQKKVVPDSETSEAKNNLNDRPHRADSETDETVQDGSARNDSITKRSESEEPSQNSSTNITAEPSIAGSVYGDVELDKVLPTNGKTQQNFEHLLRRTVSSSQFTAVNLERHTVDVYPRHLSFSMAEDSVLTWGDIIAEHGALGVKGPKAQLAEQELIAKDAKRINLLINELDFKTVRWTQDQISSLQYLLTQADEEENNLESMYSPHGEHADWLHARVEGTLRDQKGRFEEGGREIETVAAKLEYEIGGLRSRVEDVEAGVGDFEKGVRRMEDRVAELEKAGEATQWSCVVC
nr:protein stb2 [Quercus suber]